MITIKYAGSGSHLLLLLLMMLMAVMVVMMVLGGLRSQRDDG